MKKNYLNIVPQEVTKNGKRSLRYKGSDGKMHGIESGDGGETLAVEEVTRELELSFSTNNAVNTAIAEFIMRYGTAKLLAYEVITARYAGTSANKIYFDNGIQGPCQYYYNLSSSAVSFQTSGGVIEEIERSTFNTDMEAVKDFFNRTVNSVIDKLTPYNIYYLMFKANFIIGTSKLTVSEKHLIGTAKDGTKTDYGILHPIYTPPTT